MCLNLKALSILVKLAASELAASSSVPYLYCVNVLA